MQMISGQVLTALLEWVERMIAKSAVRRVVKTELHSDYL